MQDDAEENAILRNCDLPTLESMSSYRPLSTKLSSSDTVSNINNRATTGVGSPPQYRKSEPLAKLMQPRSSCRSQQAVVSNMTDQPGTVGLSSCIQFINASFATNTAPIRQLNMRWRQDCIITDGFSMLEVYLGDEHVTSLLGLTCAQAERMYERSRLAASNGGGESKEDEEFERRNSLLIAKMKSLRCVMILSYDAEESKFCVWDMENITYV